MYYNVLYYYSIINSFEKRDSDALFVRAGSIPRARKTRDRGSRRELRTPALSSKRCAAPDAQKSSGGPPQSALPCASPKAPPINDKTSRKL